MHGQGSGKMPGFGQRPAEPAVETFPARRGCSSGSTAGKDRPAGPGMLPTDLIEQIVVYERSLRVNAFIALLSWDPEIRNILSLGVGIAILIGSVILLLVDQHGPAHRNVDRSCRLARVDDDHGPHLVDVFRVPSVVGGHEGDAAALARRRCERRRSANLD